MALLAAGLAVLTPSVWCPCDLIALWPLVDHEWSDTLIPAYSTGLALWSPVVTILGETGGLSSQPGSQAHRLTGRPVCAHGVWRSGPEGPQETPAAWRAKRQLKRLGGGRGRPGEEEVSSQLGSPLRLGSTHAFLECIYQASVLPALVKGH